MADDTKPIDATEPTPAADTSPEPAPAQTPPDAKPAGLDAAVATEAEGVPEKDVASPWSEAPAPGLEDASQHDDEEGESVSTPAPVTGSPSPSDDAEAVPTSAGSEGASGTTPPADAPAAEPEVSPEAPKDEVAPATPEAPSDGTPGASPSASEPAPTEAAPSPSEAAPSEPEAPKLGDVRQEVSDLNDLPAGALDTLREGGVALFLFLAEMAGVESDGLSDEAKARLSNVRDNTVRLLSAIESVFVRHG